MRSRCRNPNNPSFRSYGGRGIGIDPRWDDFTRFREWSLENGYSDDLTLERRDNDGDYSPDNCSWASRDKQVRNRRVSRLSQPGLLWLDVARNNGLTKAAFFTRLRRGWSEQVAATTPALRGGRRVTKEEWLERGVIKE